MSSGGANTIYQYLFDDGDMYFAVVDHLFEVPLYGWYIVGIEQFAPGDIKGVLMTCPIEIQGPFDDANTALEQVRSQLNNPPVNSQPS